MARAESTQDRGAARLAAGPEIISGPAAAGASPKQRSARRKRIELTILLGPPLILFIGFVFVPMIFAIWYSLYNWNGYGPLSDFIGLQNYQGVVTGSVFHQALLHNIIIAVLSVVIQLPISIGLALLLNRRMRGQTAMRLAVFTPYVLSQATSAVMWSMLLSHGGPVDSLLKSAGLAALIHFWLASTSLVLYTLFFVVTWQFIGFGIVLLLAGLQGIPPELREAAAIDGASSWQITRRIMLPLLGPTIRIWIFLAVIGSLQLFDIVWIMTLGGPANASQTILTSAVSWQAVQNSAIIAVVATALAMALGSIAAFALSRYAFRGREGLFLLFTAGLLFPLNTAALPLFLLLQKIGLNDNLFGVALPEAAFSLPVTIVILRPFMRAIPAELEDAATVDGATRIRFFVRILLPLSRPALITVGMLAFVTSWNTYLLPLIVLSTPSHFTLPLSVAMFQSQYSTDTAKVFAYTALSMLPVLSIFVFAQRYLVGGLVGAIRG